MVQFDIGDSVKVRLVFGTNLTKLALRLTEGAATLRVRDATGYSAATVFVIDPGTDDEESLTVQSVSGLTITPTTTPIYSHAQNAQVWKLTDPTTVTLRVRKADGTVTTYTYAAADLTKVSTGIYTKSLEPDGSGDWRVEAVGTGAVVAAVEATFRVRASQVP